MRSEMVGFAAPLLPVFELRMRRSAGLAPTRPSNLRDEHSRSTLFKGFLKRPNFSRCVRCQRYRVCGRRPSSLARS